MINTLSANPGSGSLNQDIVLGFLSRMDIGHNNLGNEFFKLFLDPSMTWSGAYFEYDNMDLEEAQLAKYDRLCRQLNLSPSDHVLEIGSGWGSNAIYMAQQYGCRVTTVTTLPQQYQLAVQRVEAEGVENQVTILLKDYRELSGQYDKIVSIEKLEAADHRYLDTYFQKCCQLLKPKGLLALQVITFPDRPLPSANAIHTAVGSTDEMTLVDGIDLGLHYAATLRLWFMQFNSRREELFQLGFDDRFIRKWNDYLCYCEAAFRMRNIQVMQLTYAKPDKPVH